MIGHKLYVYSSLSPVNNLGHFEHISINLGSREKKHGIRELTALSNVKNNYN